MSTAQRFSRIARVLARSAFDDPELEQALADLDAIETALDQATADLNRYVKRLKEAQGNAA